MYLGKNGINQRHRGKKKKNLKEGIKQEDEPPTNQYGSQGLVA